MKAKVNKIFRQDMIVFSVGVCFPLVLGFAAFGALKLGLILCTGICMAMVLLYQTGKD